MGAMWIWLRLWFGLRLGLGLELDIPVRDRIRGRFRVKVRGKTMAHRGMTGTHRLSQRASHQEVLGPAPSGAGPTASRWNR